MFFRICEGPYESQAERQPMKEIIIFPFNYRNKTEFLINRHLCREPLKTLYMAPHLGKIRDFKIRYSVCRPSEALLPATHSLKTLATELVERFSGLRIIGEVEKYMAVISILKESGTGRLVGNNISGVALAVMQFIRDIKISSGSGIDLPGIRKKVSGYDWKFAYNLDILLDALGVMEEYAGFLDENGLMDTEDIYGKAAACVGDIAWNNLLMEGFYEIPEYQRAFVKALFEKVENITFSFCMDQGVSPDVRDLILDRTLAFLEEAGDWQKKEIRGNGCPGREECYNFSSQPEEVKGIAGLISAFLASNPGASLNDIMVVFPSMLQYRPVVRRIFERYNLPCEIIPGYSLSRDPSISTLLDFFVFRSSFDWEVLMDMVASPCLKNMKNEKAAEFSARSRAMFERTGFHRDNFFASGDPNLLVIKSLMEKVPRGRQPCAAWIDLVYTIIEKLGWEPGIPEVRYSFEKVLESMRSPVAFTVEEFLSVLMKSFGLIDIQEGRGHGIKVSGVLESVGIEKKLCFVGGATDENMPQAPSVEEIFIPDAIKSDLGFTDYRLRIARERFDIYRLRSENEHVIFTYPSKMSDSNRMKSIFLFGLEESFTEEDLFIPSRKEIFKHSFSRQKFIERFAPSGRLEISVTQLETLLRCPFRFYLERVEKLKVYNKPEVGESPDIWGTLIHGVMEKTFSGLVGRKILQGDCEELASLFEKILSEEIVSLHENGEISSFYMDVMKMRTGEVTNKFRDILPVHAGSRLAGIEEEISLELDGLLLKGKIDRIEEKDDGSVCIIDIKTGTSNPPSYTGQDFSTRHNIQLPLYIWMYMKKHSIDPGFVSGSIWSFNFREDPKVKNETFYKPSKLDYLEGTEDYLVKKAEKILGMADFIPDMPEGCFSCQYKGMCPYEKN